MTHNASSLHGILSSNMLFDGFDDGFDGIDDEFDEYFYFSKLHIKIVLNVI